VRRVQLRAKELAEAGFYIIVFGNANHPEVKGILDWAGGMGRAATRWEELEGEKLPPRLGILGQTTQSPEGFSQFVSGVISAHLPPRAAMRLHNTLCADVRQRQRAARELAKKVEVMVVVGGKESANTRRLVDICAANGTQTYHVEEASQLEASWFQGQGRVGITAGASTPDRAIDEVVSTIQKIAEEKERQYAAH
jgi:4-hydroxy-3-methylbut-2-enyl diphosphate reductase